MQHRGAAASGNAGKRIMQYVLGAIVFFTLQGIVWRTYSGLYVNGWLQRLFMGWAACCFAAVAASVLFYKESGASPVTLVLGLAFGLCYTIAFLAYTMAISIGSMAYSALVNSLSMLLPLLAGLFFWKETVSTFQGMGIVLAVLAAVCGVSFKQQNSGGRTWAVCAVACFFANGSIGIIQKLHQDLLQGSEAGSFIIIGFLFAALFQSGVLLLRFPRTQLRTQLQAIKGKALALLVASGIGTVLALKCNAAALDTVPASINFPVSNGSVLVLSAIASALLFKEPMGRKKVLCLLLGVCSVVFLAIPVT